MSAERLRTTNVAAIQGSETCLRQSAHCLLYDVEELCGWALSDVQQRPLRHSPERSPRATAATDVAAERLSVNTLLSLAVKGRDGLVGTSQEYRECQGTIGLCEVRLILAHGCDDARTGTRASTVEL